VPAREGIGTLFCKTLYKLGMYKRETGKENGPGISSPPRCQRVDATAKALRSAFLTFPAILQSPIMKNESAAP